jgi:hypothetical protein
VTDNTEPTAQLAELVAQRDQVQRRVDALEAELRAAAQARAEARAALVEAERRSARPPERAKAEKALPDAELKPGILAARIEGARAGVLDVDREVAQFVAEHLPSLVDDRQAEGRLVVQKIDAACEALANGYAEREAIAHEISALASKVGRIFPGDVSRSRAEEVANAARKLLQQGGEVAPELTRDPRTPRHAQAVPAA